MFSAASSESFDSDVEVLPMASAAVNAGTHAADPGGTSQEPEGIASEDGKWFQTLDERYLLPLFSNATASRTFQARRARRNASHSANAVNHGASGTPHDSEGEPDGPEIDLSAVGTVAHAQEFPRTKSPEEQSRLERGLGTPVLRNGSKDDGQGSGS